MDWNAALYRKSHGFVAEYGKTLVDLVHSYGKKARKTPASVFWISAAAPGS